MQREKAIVGFALKIHTPTYYIKTLVLDIDGLIVAIDWLRRQIDENPDGIATRRIVLITNGEGVGFVNETFLDNVAAGLDAVDGELYVVLVFFMFSKQNSKNISEICHFALILSDYSVFDVQDVSEF